MTNEEVVCVVTGSVNYLAAKSVYHKRESKGRYDLVHKMFIVPEFGFPAAFIKARCGGIHL